MSTTILGRSDGWRLHLREALCRPPGVLSDATNQVVRAMMMPRLMPPTIKVAQARAYRACMVACLRPSIRLTLQMMEYLCDTTSTDEPRRGLEQDVFTANKLNPFGAATQSEFGVNAFAPPAKRAPFNVGPAARSSRLTACEVAWPIVSFSIDSRKKKEMKTAAQLKKSSIDYAALGDRLRAYRIGASLMAEDVAEQLGVSRAVVYRMEKGEIVKIETLERLADLLATSLASLLGVEVEYYSTALGFFERMRQLEQASDRILAHFEPISVLLTSDDYLPFLREMLLEASPRSPGKGPKLKDIDEMLRIMAERKAFFNKRRPHIVSLIGLRELERFVHTGLVGRVNLPEKIRTRRVKAARREVERIADLMESELLHVQIGLIDDAMPASTFQVFSGPNHNVLAVSPYRLGELPNVRNGIATVTASPEAVRMYEEMIGRLWRGAYKGKASAQHLRNLLERIH